MSIQYMVLGFEPTTFGRESLPITTTPGLPPKTTIVVCVVPDFLRTGCGQYS